MNTTKGLPCRISRGRYTTYCFAVALAALWLVAGTVSYAGTHHQQGNTTMTNTTSHLEHIKKMAAYNSWANKQFVGWLQSADSVQWSKYIESSFSTMDLTLRHLWNAEHGWLSTLKKEPWSPAIEAEQTLPKEEMLEGFLKTSDEFLRFVEAMSEEELHDTRKLGRSEKQVSLADIIQHVFNHATYHRGQLITMGRQAGLSTPPRTDYIFFIMQ